MAPPPAERLPLVQVVVASTRPGRVGLPVAQWAYAGAQAHGGMRAEWVDLAEVALPLLDEPHHPRLQQYTRAHTRAWSETVARADGYVFVTPEYNYGPPASLKNAIDFLHHEWRHKPVAFVSYGGVSGGTRSVQATRQVMAALGMVAVTAAVNIPFVTQFLDEERRFTPDEVSGAALPAMLDELARYAVALAPLRTTPATS